MNNLKKAIAVFFILTATTLTAQIYHEECKEDLRAFMRQGNDWFKNFQALGLTENDTLAWYDNEEWVIKIQDIPYRSYMHWIEIDSKLRIDSICWNYKNPFYDIPNSLTGKLKFNSHVLKYLNCGFSLITELDVSKNINLIELICGSNNLKELDVSKNISLKVLQCNSAGLTELNVSNNTNLTHLICYGNDLIELDVSNNKELTFLWCSHNKLTNLDVTNNLKLDTLDCSGYKNEYNNFTGLDVNKNTELKFLGCYDIGLSALDVTKNTKLEYLDCNYDSISMLDLSKNVELEQLVCPANNLIELDMTNNAKLRYLNCYGNKLSRLDISKCIELTNLFCENNNLTELNVTNNAKLWWLRCEANNLTKIDVSNNFELQMLICYDNNLTKLDVTNNAKLTSLWCANNFLKFSTLPIFNYPDSVYFTYHYSPQKTIYGGIKTITDTADLSSEYNINGNITNYEWFDITDGTEKTITQPTNENGIFSFTEEHIDKKLRCNMKNAQFPLLMLVYETDIVNGIKEETITHLQISPNPTTNEATLTLDLKTSGNLNIKLVNLEGQEVIELYNARAEAGEFVKTFSMSKFSQGVYYIQIEHNGKIKMEKVVRK